MPITGINKPGAVVTLTVLENNEMMCEILYHGQRQKQKLALNPPCLLVMDENSLNFRTTPVEVFPGELFIELIYSATPDQAKGPA